MFSLSADATGAIGGQLAGAILRQSLCAAVRPTDAPKGNLLMCCFVCQPEERRLRRLSVIQPNAIGLRLPVLPRN
jgi:hypothetical protein